MTEETIFANALDKAPAERAAYLESACGGDPELRQRVEGLLQAHDAAGNFLDNPLAIGPTEEIDAGLAQGATVAPPQRAETITQGHSFEETRKHAPAAGSRIRYFGDYELIEELARGGMGVVYKARQVSLNRIVALKMILKGELASEADVQRFRHEAESAANLDHPNIVPIYEVGEHDGQQYFSMKLIEQRPREEQQSTSAEGQQRSAKLAAKVAWAVHHAHQRGLLHRDLKPSNILIDNQGEPHVADFGLAKHVEGDNRATRSGVILGTPAYMAPEQARAEKSLTTAVDVYSLGAVLYEWLLGRPPFVGPDMLAVLMKVATEEPTPPRSIDPKIDCDLETICLKCLEKDPARRYGSAEALAKELERWTRGEPIEARPAGKFERGWRWCQRNPAVASLLCLTAFMLMAGTFVSSYFGWEANRNASLYEQEAFVSKRSEARAMKGEQQARTNEEAARAHGERAEAEWTRAEEQLRLAEMRVYTEKLSQAQQAFRDGDSRSAYGFLDECQWNLRGWEHQYLWSRYHGKTLYRHPEVPSNVHFSPDGKRIISSCGRSLIVWDVENGRELVAFQGVRASFTRGGDVLFLDKDDSFKTWNSKAGLRTITTPPKVPHSLVGPISPDGKHIFAPSLSARTTMAIYDIDTNKEIQHFPGHGGWVIRSTTFSPDGKLIATGAADKLVKIWDVKTGKELRVLNGDGMLQQVLFSPTGKHLVSCTWEKAVLWDVESGQPVHRFQDHQGWSRVAFNRDGSRMVSCAPTHGIKVWDTAKGVLLFSLLSAAVDVAFSPDGKWIVSAERDQSVRLWDVAQRQEIPGWNTHSNDIRGLAMSPDGKRVAAGGVGNTIKVWEVGTGKELVTLKGHTHYVTSLAFSPDGKQIVSGTYGGWSAVGGGKSVLTPSEIKLWDAVDGKELKTFLGHEETVYGVAVSPIDGRIVSVSGDGTMRFWDSQTGKQVAAIKAHGMHFFEQGYGKGVLALAMSRDGKQVATAGHDGLVKVWDAVNQREVSTLRGHTGGAYSLAFSDDGKRLVSSGTGRGVDAFVGEIRIWDLDRGTSLSANVRAGGITRVVFSPDGKRVFAGTHDGAIKILEGQVGLDLLTIKAHGGSVRGIAVDPTGNRLITIGSGDANSTLPCDVKLWNLDLGQQRFATQAGPISGLHFRPDGKQLVSVSSERDRELRTYHPEENKVILKGVPYEMKERRHVIKGSRHVVTLWDTVKGREAVSFQAHDAWICHVEYRPDGKRLLTASEDGTLKIWNPEKKQLLDTLKADAPVTCAAFSPDGLRIVSGGKDKTATVWDVGTRKPLLHLKGHAGVLTGVAFHPQGMQIATASDDHSSILWNASTGEKGVVLVGHTGAVTSIVFSPDGRLLATSSADQTVRIWNVSSGAELLCIRGHTDRVNRVAFSPDGKSILSASTDRSVKVWDVETGEPRHILRGHREDITHAVFSPDGHSIASGGGDRTVSISILSPK